MQWRRQLCCSLSTARSPQRATGLVARRTAPAVSTAAAAMVVSALGATAIRHASSSSSGAAPPPPPPLRPLAPSSPLPPPPPPSAAGVWDDITFFNLGHNKDSSNGITTTTVAAAAEESTGEKALLFAPDGPLGLSEAMALSEQMMRQLEQRQQQQQQQQPKEEEEADESGDGAYREWGGPVPYEGGTTTATATASSSVQEAEQLATDADVEAFLRQHHGKHLTGRRDTDGAEENDNDDDIPLMDDDYYSGGYGREPFYLRSSAALLDSSADGIGDGGNNTNGIAAGVGDMIAAEEQRDCEAAEAERRALAEVWSRYLPADSQVTAAMEAGEEGDDNNDDTGSAYLAVEDGDEDTNNDDGMKERFWWQRPIVETIGEEVLPPLRIPDKDGNVAPTREEKATAAAGHPHTTTTTAVRVAAAAVRMAGREGFLARQDQLYLGPQTPPEAQAPTPSGRCVLVAFAANDLRVHDNYTLALASVRAHTAGGLPVVAVCVLDYRTFAQPSLVGGFFRQGPQRAAFLLETVAALRAKLEGECGVPLLVRVGRPEEHVPRLAVELGAVDVFLTTQYAPHERRVHDRIMRQVRRGAWVSRVEVGLDDIATAVGKEVEGEGEEGGTINNRDDDDDDATLLVRVVTHDASAGDPAHPYGEARTLARQQEQQQRATPTLVVPHSVWQSTLVHLDDLPTPVAAMKEGERWYHDDVTTAAIRPTKPYDRQTARLAELPRWPVLLPTEGERRGVESVPVLRGRLPTLLELGYAADGANADLARLIAPQELIATETSHPAAGEDAAHAHVVAWLADGGMTSMLRYGKPRRTNTKMYSGKLARVSPYIAVGALSPRRFYELFRSFANDNLRDGFVQMQYREALLRLSRRDYWHWMGLRYGERLFYSYGPHPDATDRLPDWRRDPKIVQKWCLGLNGLPFADAAMRELHTTGFVAAEGRKALVWLLTRGYGQDWRLGAEWLERCSLDYDPFVCYGNAAYFSELLPDDFGETVRSTAFITHHHDQTGIYIKKWLPQLSKVPPVYIHRPHVLTPRMQAMHGVYLGRNYPYPLKLWDGAQDTLSAAHLPAYFAGDGLTGGGTSVDAVTGTVHASSAAIGPGYAEAVRCGAAVMQPEELSTAVSAGCIARRPWARAFLPQEMLASIAVGIEGQGSLEELLVVATAGSRGHNKRRKQHTAGTRLDSV